MESDVYRMMEMADQVFASVDNMRAEAVEQLHEVKREVMKRSGK